MLDKVNGGLSNASEVVPNAGDSKVNIAGLVNGADQRIELVPISALTPHERNARPTRASRSAISPRA